MIRLASVLLDFEGGSTLDSIGLSCKRAQAQKS